VLDWQNGSDWGPEGLAYRLKACGFDHIVMSLWLLSPAAAKAFVPAVVTRVGESPIPDAFVAAYRDDLDDLGETRTYLEAGCIELMG
jgi:hypothetical protein